MIQYDLIVKELSKGLTPLSEVNQKFNMGRFKQLMEFRTIKYGSCRTSGKTDWIGICCLSDSILPDGDILYTHLNTAAVNYFSNRFLNASNYHRFTPLTIRQLMSMEHDKKYSTVFIDDSWLAASKVGINKIYRQLANIVTDDVVIHLVN